MADVARLAGVSSMTVSRALRRDASVSDRTRARVLEVVDEIGYVPDQAAGALSSGRSGLVAAIMPTLTIPFFAYVSRGLSDTLRKEGLQLFLGSSDYSTEREEDILCAVLRRRPEAIVLTSVGQSSKASRMLAGAGIPVVEFLDAIDPPVDHVIALDAAALGRATVEHLARKGRRKLAIVASPADGDRHCAARVAGLLVAATEAGLPQPSVIRRGVPGSPVEQGARGAIEAVERGSGTDAIVLMSDYAAMGALTALRELGVDVPGEIAVFGFGDCDIARHLRPSLTTISFSPVAAGVEMGKVVLSALDAARIGKPVKPYLLKLDFQLIERESA